MVAQNGTPPPSLLRKDKRTNAAPGNESVLPPPSASPNVPHVATKIKAKLQQQTERNQSATERRIRKVGKAPSAASVAVAVAVAIVSAMIAKSNSPKRCGTKRGNIFYA